MVKRRVIKHALKLRVTETLTQHYTTANIVSILSVQQTPKFMFAYLRILLCYYDISCHNATHCVTFH